MGVGEGAIVVQKARWEEWKTIEVTRSRRGRCCINPCEKQAVGPAVMPPAAAEERSSCIAVIVRFEVNGHMYHMRRWARYNRVV